MSNGLKGKVKEIVLGMDAIRKGDGGREIGLRQFMAERFPNDGKPLTPEHLFAELDINPRTTRVDQLMADEDNKYLFAELVREGVRRGMGLGRVSQAPITKGADGSFINPTQYLDAQRLGLVQAAFYQDLVVREVSVSQPAVTVPALDLSAATLKDTNELETIEEGSVSYGKKTVELRKRARGIKISYEAIRYNTLDLVQTFFEDAGNLLGHQLNQDAIGVLVNGDVSGGGEAAAVIGVESTSNGLDWPDLVRVAVRGGLIGRQFSQVICNETTGNAFLNLDEVKERYAGNPLLNIAVRTQTALPEELFISPAVPANYVIFNDPSRSLVQLTSAPLMVETEKLIWKQLEGSVVSITTGFAKLARNASVAMAVNVAYSGAQFPAWMAPFSAE